MPDAADAIISIHPTYADAILAGKKTIELRRRIPELVVGTRLWIYATRPMAAIIGVAKIQEVARAHPRTIWKKHRNGSGVDYASFNAYFKGAQEAIAILLQATCRIEPITIDQLRKIRNNFHPPQVLTRLTYSETKTLRKLAVRYGVVRVRHPRSKARNLSQTGCRCFELHEFDLRESEIP